MRATETKKNEIQPDEDPEFYDALEEREDHQHNEDPEVQTHNEVHVTQFAVERPPEDEPGKDSHPKADENLVNLLVSPDADSFPEETDPNDEKKTNVADNIDTGRALHEVHVTQFEGVRLPGGETAEDNRPKADENLVNLLVPPGTDLFPEVTDLDEEKETHITDDTDTGNDQLRTG